MNEPSTVIVNNTASPETREAHKDLPATRTPYLMTPTTFTEAMQLSEIISKSSFCPSDYRGKQGDVFVAIQMGAEVGLRPLQALQSIAVINGKPSIYGDAALALVRATGELEDFDEHFEQGEGDSKEEGLIGVCLTKRRGEMRPVVRRFSVAMAKKAGLYDKSGPWKSYPQRMLQMRARSWTLRDGWADVLKGLHIREEVEDYIETTATPVAETIATETANRQDALKKKYEQPKTEPPSQTTASCADPVSEPTAEKPPATDAPEPGSDG